MSNASDRVTECIRSATATTLYSNGNVLVILSDFVTISFVCFLSLYRVRASTFRILSISLATLKLEIVLRLLKILKASFYALILPLNHIKFSVTHPLYYYKDYSFFWIIIFFQCLTTRLGSFSLRVYTSNNLFTIDVIIGEGLIMGLGGSSFCLMFCIALILVLGIKEVTRLEIDFIYANNYVEGIE